MKLKVYKETSLPNELTTDSLYFVTGQGDYVDLFITGNTQGVVKRVITADDIVTLIDEKVDGLDVGMTFQGTIDLQTNPSGPEKLQSLFVVEQDFGDYSENDLLLKVSEVAPYFLKINTESSGGGGTSKPFEVTEWAPTSTGLVDIEPNVVGATYVDGVMTKAPFPPYNINTDLDFI